MDRKKFLRESIRFWESVLREYPGADLVLERRMSPKQLRRFYGKLEEGEIQFRYQKKDGSIRQARGTLNAELMPKKTARSDWYRDFDDLCGKARNNRNFIVFYYDLDRNAFRRFHITRFRGYVDRPGIRLNESAEIQNEDRLVLVRNVKPDLFRRLAKTSVKDVSRFNPAMVEKLAGQDNAEIICLFKVSDGKNILAAADVDTSYDIGAYIHELVGFRRTYGKILFRRLMRAFPKGWGQIQLDYIGDDSDGNPKYAGNEALFNGFYKKFSELKFYDVENSIWGCPARCFYWGIPDTEFSKFAEEQFGGKSS